MIHSIVPAECIMANTPREYPERESLIMGIRVSMRGSSLSRVVSSNPMDYLKAGQISYSGFNSTAHGADSQITMKN